MHLLYSGAIGLDIMCSAVIEECCEAGRERETMSQVKKDLNEVLSAIQDGIRSNEDLKTWLRDRMDYSDQCKYSIASRSDVLQRGLAAVERLKLCSLYPKDLPADQKSELPTQCFCSACERPPCSFCEPGEKREEPSE